nr:E3 ubiquitin-protein ligase AMFR-like [Dermatophagoides farinae]
MPNFLDAPEILPLPSLQTYASISFLLLSCAIYYAFQVSSEPDWKLNEFLFIQSAVDNNNNSNNTHHHTDSNVVNGNIIVSNTTTTNIIITNDGIKDHLNQNNGTIELSYGTTANNYTLRNAFIESLFRYPNDSITLNELLKNQRFVTLLNVTYIMIHEPLCVWTLINMSYCLLILFGKLIQKLVFGDLRASEQQLLRDKFWNFLLYKFIFVFSVINVQYMDELILWCAWFSVLGFMFLLTNLCKERYSFLANTPTISRFEHIKLLTLLVSILMSTLPLFIIGVIVGNHTSLSIGAFLICEVSIISLRSLQCLILYIIHLCDLRRDSIWEKRTAIIYYIELIFDLSVLSIDFCHHIHMLSSGNIILSVSSVVILIQLRSIFTDIIRRLKKHRNYLQVLNLMEENFPTATRDELTDENNDCAICWDRMENARQLPCGHFFHTACLRSWLEQDTSCPTCRHSLRQRDQNRSSSTAIDGRSGGTMAGVGVGGNVQNIAGGTGFEDLANIANLAGLRPGNTRFFHFDGSRYATWLPSFSVEVTRPNIMDININASVTRNEQAFPDYLQQPQQQIDYMGQQVLEWFPQFSLTSILDDLRNTRSVELTIENILDGRLRPITSTTNTTNNLSSTAQLNSQMNQNNNLENNILSENRQNVEESESDDDDDDDLIEIINNDGDNNN